MKNTDADLQVFVKTQLDSEDGKNIRIYAKPNVGTTYSEYILVAEGKLEEENNIVFYSYVDDLKNALENI